MTKPFTSNPSALPNEPSGELGVVQKNMEANER